MARRSTWWAAVVTSLAVTIGACGSDQPGSQAESPAPTTAFTQTSFTPTPVETTAEPSPEPTEDESFDPIADTPSPTAAVLSTTDSGRALTLSDVFAAEGDWEESRYDIANRADVQGMGVTLSSCRDEYEARLELRLAHRFSKLTMNIGQANTSKSSDRALVVEVITNGKQQDERRIPFDRIQPFSINVHDINALEVRLWMEYGDGCDYDDGIIAVIEKMTVYG